MSRESYDRREASVRGAVRCVRAGMITYVPASMRKDVERLLKGAETPYRIEDLGDGTWRLRKVYP